MALEMTFFKLEIQEESTCTFCLRTIGPGVIDVLQTWPIHETIVYSYDTLCGWCKEDQKRLLKKLAPDGQYAIEDKGEFLDPNAIGAPPPSLKIKSI